MKSGKKKGGLTSLHKSYRIKLGIWRNTNSFPKKCLMRWELHETERVTDEDNNGQIGQHKDDDIHYTA